MHTIFKDRDDAARRLAHHLSDLAGSHPLVLAIPRGAVKMGSIIAGALGGELDVALVRKLGAPRMPEVAIGAVDETGERYVAPDARLMGAIHAYLEKETAIQLATLLKRRTMYTPGREAPDIVGRNVIVVDDGMATGATMLSALRMLRRHKPGRLICAVPVASREAVALISPYADQVICLNQPAGFRAVGEFYEEFPQVEDAEVIRLLAAPHEETA